MNSPARRKAASEYEAKLQGEGWRKVTFRASPEMSDALDSLIARHGSLQAAMRAILMPAPAHVSQRGSDD
jgi:hypothetical protein